MHENTMNNYVPTNQIVKKTTPEKKMNSFLETQKLPKLIKKTRQKNPQKISRDL